MKHLSLIAAGVLAILTLAACNPTPQQQRAMRCAGATGLGAAVGAGIGNQFGGGTGQAIMTGAGAAAGATYGQQMSC